MQINALVDSFSGIPKCMMLEDAALSPCLRQGHVAVEDETGVGHRGRGHRGPGGPRGRGRRLQEQAGRREAGHLLRAGQLYA